MKREDLYDGITQVRDELVVEALQTPLKRKHHWGRWTALAAVLCLVIGVGRLTLGGSGGGSGGETTDGSFSFMSYDGPVFPLTVLNGAETLTAERTVTWDFSPWIPEWISNQMQVEEARQEGASGEELTDYAATLEELFPEGGYTRYDTDAQVTDSYLLTNFVDTDVQVEVLYPYTGSLREETDVELTVDGAALETTLHAGPYTGGFAPAWGDESGSEDTLNLDHIESWEGYRALLSDGTYQELALEGHSGLSQVPVVVYEITDVTAPPEDEVNTNPTLEVAFPLDDDKTTILTYGFHGSSWDAEEGWMEQRFSIPQPHEPGLGDSYYLLVVGEDLTEYTINGYRTGGDNAPALEGVSAVVNRYESDLDTMLRRLEELYWQEFDDLEEYAPGLSKELFHSAVCQMLTTYGPLGGEAAMRFEPGWLESLFSDVSGMERVFYLRAEITVPANSTVELTAQLTKEGSYDYTGAAGARTGVYGYDLVTRLGSTLTFTSVSSEVTNWEYIQIVNQNFGFDPGNGITKVTLDPEQEHYYLEVQRKSQE